MNRTTFAALLAFFLVAAGCSGARLVERTQTGGIIALQGDRDEAWAEAEAQIRDHCGEKGHHIVREGETVVGERTEYDERTDKDREGESTDGSAATYDVTEWRVEYMCGEPTPEPASAAASEPDDRSPSAKYADEEKAESTEAAAPEAPADESPSARRAREEKEAADKKAAEDAAGNE